MAEKEEVGTLSVSIVADTTQFKAEMGELAADAQRAGAGVQRALAGIAAPAANIWAPMFAGLDTAIDELAGNLSKVTTGAGMAGIAAGADEASSSMKRAALEAGNFKAQLLGLSAGAAHVWAPYLNTTAQAVDNTRALAAATKGMSAGMAGVWGPMLRNMQQATAPVKSLVTAIQQVPPAAAAATAKINAMANASRTAVKGTSFLAANLAAQFQDVFVQIQAGTPILQTALQQGTQMALVFNSAADAGATMGQRLALVGSAFKSIFGPATLIPIALIAATAAAAKFFTTTEKDAKSAAELLKEYKDQLKEISDTFDINTADLEAFALKSRGLVTAETLANLAKIPGPLQSIINLVDQLGEKTEFASRGFIPDAEKFLDPQLRSLVKDFALALEAGNADLQEWENRFLDLAKTDPDIAKQTVAVINFIEEAKKAPAAVTALQVALNRLRNAQHFAQLENDAKKLSKTLDEIRKIHPIEENTVQLFKRLGDEIRLANPDFEQMVQLMQELSDARTRLAESEKLDFQIGELGGLFDLLKKREGFIPTPQMDSGELALGFGMHQWITASGAIKKISQEMITDQGEALKQLAMQWEQIYFPEVLKVISKDQWDKLSDNVQQAVASVVWNFGTIKPALADALKAGGDPQLVAAAIRGLKGLNEGVNDTRREEEALVALGQSLKSAAEAQQKFILSEKDAIAVQTLHNKLIFEGTYEQERQTYILAARLKKLEEGIPITDEMNRVIEEAAVLHANEAAAQDMATEATRKKTEADKLATEARKELAEQQRHLQQAFDAVSNKIEDAFIDAIFNGKELNQVIGELIKSLAMMAVRAQLANMFAGLFGGIGGNSAGGGWLGPIVNSFIRNKLPAPGASMTRAAAIAPPIVQLNVQEGAMFEPRVARISGNVSVRTVTAATPALSRAAMAATQEHARAYG